MPRGWRHRSDRLPAAVRVPQPGRREAQLQPGEVNPGRRGAVSQAAGIGLGNVAGPKSARGIFRDNILRAGACSIARIDFIETEAGTSPRLFEHNDLDPTGAPTSLYLTGAAKSLATPMAVNALPGASGNLSVDPMFVSLVDLHLAAASACVNAGTPVGAPKTDFDGKARDDRPDIGAYER